MCVVYVKMDLDLHLLEEIYWKQLAISEVIQFFICQYTLPIIPEILAVATSSGIFIWACFFQIHNWSSANIIHNNDVWFFPSFRVSVCPSVTTSPAAANGPIDMIFGMGMDIEDHMPILGKSRSKVKVKKVKKNWVLQQLLVTGTWFWSIQDRRGSGEVLLAACQLILAACQL